MTEKIVHLADFQIEARNSGIGNRYDEYKNGLTDTLESIKTQSPGIIIITGDLYQFADTSSAERQLLTWFLRELSSIANVVITNGNHDLKQRNNQLIISDKNQTQPDDIESVLDAMNNNNITYLKRTGFYEVYGKTFAVWGHYEKFNKVGEDQLPYSPWELPNASDFLEMAKNGDLIELYHDPISQCKGFSGKPEKHFEEYKVDLNHFKARLVLAGDIHAPDVLTFNTNALFTYCSSTIMRNYGEGNYYRNDNLYQAGNDMHGYNVVTKTDGVYSIEFMKIVPRVGRHTIIFDKNFDYNNIDLIDIEACDYNLVRFVVEDNVNDFFMNQEALITNLKNKYLCLVEEPKFDKNVGIEMDDEHTVDNIESIVTEDKILELSEIYIDKVIDKTTTIPNEDKAQAKTMLVKLFKDEFLRRVDSENAMKIINVKRLLISNALSFGDGVEVLFDENGITRITGTNAVGKTKIFTILGFMFTDKIYSEQKSTQVKGNRLDLFNYTRPNDEVYNMMEFDINNQPYVLEKRITRSWKRGKSMWNDKDWREHISATPEMEVTLTTPTGIITDINEVLEFMSDLITFEEFNTHLFVNQKSLESLLKMNPDLLIGEILKIIGLNFFDSLNESFDLVKDTMTDRLVKPFGTLDSLIEDINVSQNEIENLGFLIDSNVKVIQELNELQNESNSKRDELVKQIGHTRKVSDVSFDIDILDVKKQSLNSDKERTENTITSYTSFISSINITEIKQSNENYKNSIIVDNKAMSVKEIELSQTNVLVDNIKNECRHYRTEVENKKLSKKNGINLIINDKNNEVTLINDSLQIIKTTILDKATELKNMRQGRIDAINESLTIVTQDQNEIMVSITAVDNEININANNLLVTQSLIDNLTSGKICPTCKRDKDDSTLSGINESIVNHNREIDSFLEKSTLLFTKKENLTNEFNEITKRKDVIQDKLTTERLVEVTYSLKDDEVLSAQAMVLIESKKNIATEIEELQLSKTVIDNDKSYLKDEYITSRLSRIDNISKEENSMKEEIASLVSKVSKSEQEIISNEQIIESVREKEMLIVKEQSNLNNILKDLEISNEKYIYLQTELKNAEGAKTLYDSIALLKSEDEIRKNEIDLLNADSTKHSNRIVILDADIIRFRNDIVLLKEYTLTTAVIKQYKTMLGKTGIQKYIFGKIVDILNAKLSSLLEDVDFRLFFDKESLDLRKYNLSKNIISGVQMTSGMETSILGLSLLNSLKMLNQIRRFNFIMIDEVSGQLNNGKNLSYDAQDYQELFVKLLHKILESSNIFIVDHVLETLGESRILEVQGTNDGSIIKIEKY